MNVTKIYGHKMQYHKTPSLSEGNPGTPGYHGDPKMRRFIKWKVAGIPGKSRGRWGKPSENLCRGDRGVVVWQPRKEGASVYEHREAKGRKMQQCESREIKGRKVRPPTGKSRKGRQDLMCRTAGRTYHSNL